MPHRSESRDFIQARPVLRKLEQLFASRETASRSSLTNQAFVTHVAEALCREWYDEKSNSREIDAQFWKQFCLESRVAIQAYLDALEDAGYRIVSPKN